MSRKTSCLSGAAKLMALSILGPGLMAPSAQATVVLTGVINQAGVGVVCQGGGNATSTGATISLSGVCTDATGSSTSFLIAKPGSLGVSATAVSNSSSTVPENGGGVASYSGTIIFTSNNPSLTSTVVILHWYYHGLLNGVGQGGATAQIGFLFAGTLIGARLDEFTGRPVTCIETGFSGLNACGAVAAPGAFFSNAFAGIPVRVPLNTPVNVGFTLLIGAGASLVGSSVGAFDQTVRFVEGQDIFTVDPGIFVDAPDSFIFNNRYTPPGLVSGVPEPTTWSIMGFGAFAVGTALRRRRGRRLGHA